MRSIFGRSRVTQRERPKIDRKSTRLNSSHQIISYAVFCLKKKKHATIISTEPSLAIWPDHAKLVGYGLNVNDANKPITTHISPATSGSIGAEPSTGEQEGP